jgi:hypothetical protein
LAIPRADERNNSWRSGDSVCQTDQLSNLVYYLLPSTMSVTMGVEKTVEIAAYLRTLFAAELRGNVDSIQMPVHWDLEILEECHYMVKLVVQAMENESG